MLKQYTCGLLFSEMSISRAKALLIRKNRPKWQAGLLNGVGGNLERGETPVVGMNREFEEEAGISGLPWIYTAIITSETFQIHFFSAVHPGALSLAVQRTDEALERHYVRDLWQLPVVSDLHIIVPLALDTTGIVKPILIQTKLVVTEEKKS